MTNKEGNAKKESFSSFRNALEKVNYHLRYGYVDEHDIKILRHAVRPFPLMAKLDKKNRRVEITLIRTDAARLPEKGDPTVTQVFDGNFLKLFPTGRIAVQPGVVSEVGFDLEALKKAIAMEEAENVPDKEKCASCKYDTFGEVTVDGRTTSVGIVFDVRELFKELEMSPPGKEKNKEEEMPRKDSPVPNLPLWDDREEEDSQERREDTERWDEEELEL